MRPLVFLAALVSLAGCRFEARPDPVCDCADGRDLAEAPPEPRAAGDSLRDDPPVSLGDTARVTRDEAAVADATSAEPVAAAGGYVVPVVGVAPSDLVDTYEAARSEGRTHHAIDILAPRGTPVVAAAPGTVARLFTSEKGGLTVYVLGPDRRTVYYYAHLDAYAPGLEAGDALDAGSPVGTVGDSGNAAPGNTHLHFAIWRAPDAARFWDGDPINPYPLLTGRR